MRLGLRVGALCALAGMVAACGISAEGRVTNIPADELPAVLANPPTTIPSTTQPATTAPETTVAQSAPAETTTTTTQPIQLTDVTVFYVQRGTDDVVKPVVVARPDPTLRDLVGLLAEPTDVAQLGLDTAVERDLVVSTDIQRLWTVVDLDPEILDRLTGPRQRLALAQIVLTLTLFATPETGPVSAVVFTLGGEPMSVPLPEQGSSPPDTPVAFADFAVLIDTDTPATTSTTTTTEPPPSSMPPADPALAPTSTGVPAEG